MSNQTAAKSVDAADRDHDIPYKTMRGATKLALAYTTVGAAQMYIGGPGVGKTSLGRQIAEHQTKKFGRPWNHKTEQAILSDPTDVKGFPTIERVKIGEDVLPVAKWAQADMLPRVDRDGEFGVFIIDEINAASPSVMASFMRLVLEKRVGDYVMPAGWIIVGTGNRQSDRAAANRMPTALASRFSWIEVHCETDQAVDEWCDWGDDAGLDPYLLAAAKFLGPNHLYNLPKTGDVRAFANPRAWEEINNYLSEPDDVTRGEMINGKIGSTTGRAVNEFLSKAKKIPPFEKLIADPDNSWTPPRGELGLAATVEFLLARRADRQNFANVHRYAERLGPEAVSAVVNDACRRTSGLHDTKTYQDWAIKYQEIVR